MINSTGHLGEVKKFQVKQRVILHNIRITQKITNLKSSPVYNMISAQDIDGNLIMWRSCRDCSEFEEGKLYTIVANIRKHDYFKNKPQTIVEYVSKLK